MSVGSATGRHRGACRLVAFAGGKGGVGKTICASNLALHVSQRNRVLALDLDIGCGNLNASLGVRAVRHTIDDFLASRVGSLNDITVKTQVDGLRLVCCSYTPAASTALSIAQTNRLIEHMRHADADYVFMDLGAGTGKEVLDLFAAADLKIIVTAPESLALHNAFMFVKSLAFRVVSRGVELGRFSRGRRANIIKQVYSGGDEELARIIDRVGFGDARAAVLMRQVLSSIKVGVILNKVQEAGEEKFVSKLRNLTRKYLDLDLNVLGSIPSDPNIKKSLNEVVPFALEYPLSPANAALKQIAMKIQASVAAADPEEEFGDSFAPGPLSRAVSMFTGRFRGTGQEVSGDLRVMQVAAAEKQQFGILALLGGVTIVVVHSLAQANSSSTFVMIAGVTACVIAFLNSQAAVYFLIAAMLLSPEFSVGQTAGNATLARPVTLRVDDVLLLVICGTWFLKSVLYKDVNLLRKTPLNGAIALYVTACLVSTMIGILDGRVFPTTGLLFVFKYIEYFLIFWMIVNTAQSEAQVRRFLLVLFLVALTVSVMAISQIPSGARISAPFEGNSGEPNTLGGYLLFIFAILSGVILADRRYRMLTIPLAALLVIALAYTLSRASYLGFIPVAFALPILTRRLGVLVLVTVVALVVILSPALILPRAVLSRIDYTFTQQRNTQQVSVLGRRVDTSTSARLIYMSAATEAFVEKPVFGWGVTGWHFVDSQYFRTLSETGLVGVAAFMYLVYRIFSIAFYSRRQLANKDPTLYGVACGFIAGFIGLLFHAIGSNTFIIVRIMEPFWLCCALVYILPEIVDAAEPAV